MVWMIFSVILGWLMARVIISLLFYIIITPIGLFLRIIGKDLLDLKEQKKTKNHIGIFGTLNKSRIKTIKSNFKFLRDN